MLMAITQNSMTKNHANLIQMQLHPIQLCNYSNLDNIYIRQHLKKFNSRYTAFNSFTQHSTAIIPNLATMQQNSTEITSNKTANTQISTMFTPTSTTIRPN